MRRHTCEPPHYPTATGQEWACDECGKRYYSTNDFSHLSEDVRKHIPAGTWGWTTSREGS